MWFYRRKTSVKEDRVIYINNVQASSFCSNRIVTSKYTAWNFLFKNLAEQFHKVSNVYFLFIAVLQCVPAVSTTNGMPTLALPLAIVLILSGAKDAYEDWRRHKSDDLENNNFTHFLPPLLDNKDKKITTFKNKIKEKEEDENEDEDIDDEERELEKLGLIKVKWCDVNVGDLIVCLNRECFPADLVLLASSDAHGVCFIETSSLDGETNLKVKQANKSIHSLLGQNCTEVFRKVTKIKGSLTCNAPNKDLNTFNAKISLFNVQNNNIWECNSRVSSSNTYDNNYNTKNDSNGNLNPHATVINIPINNQQLLLRGCKLRNTDWIIGLVVHTGPETKIQKNSTEPVRKTSKVEKMTNKLTVFIWIVQLVVSLIGGIVSTFLAHSSEFIGRQYLLLNIHNKSNPFIEGIVNFLTWVVLTCNFVPISLIVTMGMVKAMQAYFIMIDKDMYDIETNTFACPRTSDLNEELGLVEYVFSDKTGTLTSNVMQFKKCFINGISYGKGLTEIRRQVLLKSNKVVSPEPKPPLNAKVTPNVNFIDEMLEQHIKNPCHPNHKSVMDFFLHLAVNHSVVPEIDNSGHVRYSASSPDEGALVYGAKHFGIEFKARTPYGVNVSILGKIIEVEILAIIDFDSVRKRSSVLCKIQNENKEPRIVLFCKGADIVIQERLHHVGKKEENTFQAMQDYAIDGLRTLCIAKRDLTIEEFKSWYKKYEEVSMAMEDRENKIKLVAEEIEVNLLLQGITGIEDKLQDGVGDTIESLRQAGIRIWMLTGDKVETAINIGIATSLLTHEMKKYIFEIDGDHPKDQPTLLQNLQDITKSVIECEPHIQHCTIIDGIMLSEMLKKDLEKAFLDLCKKCDAVICCRVTPHQKGAVISMVKKYENKITLAIGDGANDCNMIQSADVGIGIRGQEGLQAFNTADYGLSKFSFLKILLLVHGRWSYRRITKLALYMFYKNIVLVMPIFYFGALSLFSGQKFYYEFSYQMYNVVYTSLPIIVFGVLDQDVDKRTVLKYPYLYKLGHANYYFNNKVFCQWIANGICHAAIIFIITVIGFAYYTIPTANGLPFDLWMVGTIIYLVAMITVSFKVVLETYYLTWISVFTVFLSIFAYLLFNLLFSSSPSFAGSITGTLFVIMSSANFWILVFLTVFLCLGRDWLWKSVKKNFFPEFYHYIQLKQWRKKKQWGQYFKSLRKTLYNKPDALSVQPTSADGRSGSSRSFQRGFAFSEADTEAVCILRRSKTNTFLC